MTEPCFYWRPTAKAWEQEIRNCLPLLGMKRLSRRMVEMHGKPFEAGSFTTRDEALADAKAFKWDASDVEIIERVRPVLALLLSDSPNASPQE